MNILQQLYFFVLIKSLKKIISIVLWIVFLCLIIAISVYVIVENTRTYIQAKNYRIYNKQSKLILVDNYS